MTSIASTASSSVIAVAVAVVTGYLAIAVGGMIITATTGQDAVHVVAELVHVGVRGSHRLQGLGEVIQILAGGRETGKGEGDRGREGEESGGKKEW